MVRGAPPPPPPREGGPATNATTPAARRTPSSASSSDPAGQQANDDDDATEGHGLLLSGSSSDDDDLVVHRGPSPAKATTEKPLPPLPIDAAAAREGGGGGGGGGGGSSMPQTPRTPRTPNRVRFDLRPTTLGGDGRRKDVGGGDTESAAALARPGDSDSEGDLEHGGRSRGDSFEVDDDDPLGSPGSWSSSGRGDGGRHSSRLPLLTGLTAPAVAVAADDRLWTRRRAAQDGEANGSASAASEQHLRPRSGLLAAFVNMANSIIGAGIIGQPYALKQAGLAAGLVLLVGLTLVVDWTIRLIVLNSKLAGGADSFQSTVERALGVWGLRAISAAQWAFAFGGMVAFGVIVGDSIPHVLRAIWPDGGWLLGRRVVIVLLVMGVSYPLTLYRDIAKLAKASTLALISMAVILFTVVVQGLLVPREDRGSFNLPLLTVNGGIFQAIGVISFAFVCHHNSLLIYGSLKTPTMDRFATVTHYSTGVSMVACLVMALAGFLTFGDRTLGNVLNNFAGDNTMVNIARLCFGLNMLTTLPLEAFVCREVMLNYFYPGEPFSLRLHVALSTGLVFSAMLISLVTCDLGVVFELVGATSACALAYILPPLCYIKLSSRSWKTYAAWAVVAFGCIVMVISVVQAIGKIISGGGETAQCM